ncbi:MAG: tyrosine-type recombinase/integrase [Gammaproteobacteria bacterium]|nr:tyrosine-type recombinase/integrase [Gammaproteobacteria bacterium]MDH3805213.1 tyrosine-type recombinase/integrase [Gammaproteobacteria bacterium]
MTFETTWLDAARMHITKRLIDRFVYEGKNGSRDVRWDDRLPGFGVRIYPSGFKSFVLSYRCQGRKRLMVLGRYGVLTLDMARDNARQAMVDSVVGSDPLDQRAKRNQGETVADLAETYIERHAKVHKRTWIADQRAINKYVLPAWATKKIRNLDRSDVARLHHDVGRVYPYTANRLLELISKMCELARVWGFVDEGATNPARGITRFKEHKRDRYVTPQELPKLAAAIDNESNLYARYALWLFLLTGLRKSELLQARWTHVDWDREELSIHDTKNGRPLHLPLSSAALALLRQLPREEGNPFLFPGRDPGKNLVNIDKAWRRIRAEAGVPDVRLHDLRRTVGSWLAQSGNSLHLIGRVLNHRTPSTTQVYARFGNDHVRDALESLGQNLLGAAGKKSAADIVKLSSAR